MSHVLITGGSRGIGRACALAFASAGWEVSLGYVQNRQAAEETVRRIRQAGGQAACYQADVGDSSQTNRMFDQAEQTFGPAEALVCSAGLAWQGLLTDMTDDQWRRLTASLKDLARHGEEIGHCVVLEGLTPYESGLCTTAGELAQVL